MTSAIPFEKHAGRRETIIVALVAFGIGVVAGLIFMLHPGLDIAISRSFLNANGKFWMARSDFWQGLRELFMRGFTIWYIVIVLSGVLALRVRKPVLSLDWQRWLYLGVCSLIGPLLLVNIILKEMWGRWRPREIVELGGQESFTSVLNAGGSCFDNCSFVSGEVASMVMIFMALALATRHWRPIHYALAVLLGALEAFIRVGQGGHFTSDAIFAGVLMALVACAVHFWFFLSAWSPLPRLERRLGVASSA